MERQVFVLSRIVIKINRFAFLIVVAEGPGFSLALIAQFDDWQDLGLVLPYTGYRSNHGVT